VAPPPKFREAVKTFLQALPGDVGWTIRDEKYMTDVLNFEKQQDSYSCGFYVLDAAMKFADDRGGMPAGNYGRYSAERTERIRKCCTRSCVAAVLSVASGMEGEESVVTRVPRRIAVRAV